jgi:hypothetical protein
MDQFRGSRSEKLRLTNAVWWATEGRRLYAAILRWTLVAQKTAPAGQDMKQMLARATTCYYQLGVYEKWEQGQVLCGKTSARRIEKMIRWDGCPETYDSLGYESVRKCAALLMPSKVKRAP